MAAVQTVPASPPSIPPIDGRRPTPIPAAPGSEDDTPPLHAVNVALRWNGSKTMIWRVLATFWCAFVMGSNDAAYGSIIPYVCTTFHEHPNIQPTSLPPYLRSLLITNHYFKHDLARAFLPQELHGHFSGVPVPILRLHCICHPK